MLLNGPQHKLGQSCEIVGTRLTGTPKEDVPALSICHLLNPYDAGRLWVQLPLTPSTFLAKE